MTRTLIELRTLARERADMTDSVFVSDAELNDYINDAIAELHDLLSAAYGSGYNQITIELTVPAPGGFGTDPGIAEFPITVTTGGIDRDVAAGLGRLVRVGAIFGNDNIVCHQFDVSTNRIDATPKSWDRETDIRYNLIYPYAGATKIGTAALEFFPVPTVDQTVQIRYILAAPVLAADSDVFGLGFDTFVVVAAAIKCLAKQQDDTRTLERELGRQRERIGNLAPPKDIGQTYTLLRNGYRRDGADYDWNGDW